MSFKHKHPSHSSVYRDAAFLSQCSENEALNWLKKRSFEYSSSFDQKVLEYILYRRNLPLINLALAEHGRSKPIVVRIYQRGNATTKVTSCANPSLFVSDLWDIQDETDWGTDNNLLWQIVREGPLPELRTVCENPYLMSEFYSSLVSSWEGDEESTRINGEPLSSDRFQHVLLYLSENPRLAVSCKVREEGGYWEGGDGSDEFSYNRLFDKCWKLAKIVPVDRLWAGLLRRVYHNIYMPSSFFDNDFYHVFDDINAVLERWRVKDEQEYSPTFHVRFQIAAKCLKPSLGQLSSNDPALRNAFYASFDPSSKEFRDLDWTEWPDRDEYCYNNLSGNEKIWCSESGRQKLENLVHHSKKERESDISDIRQFDVHNFYTRKEEYRKTNPEWFKDEDDKDEWLEDEDEGQPPDRNNEYLENLAAELQKIKVDIEVLVQVVTVLSRSQGISVLWFLASALAGSFFGSLIW